jgi:hypothetical protein
MYDPDAAGERLKARIQDHPMSDESESSDKAPGWDAIDEALRTIYSDREPLHFGTVVPYALGGPDPITGISAYKNREPRPHWHFVTYGFSDLWEKQTEDPEVSGFGFELTFRPTCPAEEENPPNWALSFLQNLGRYVFSTGNAFGVGHTLPLNGPICVGDSTRIHAVAFTLDPQLPPIETPNGRVVFLEVVGLTMDELDAISSWDVAAFLELRAQDDPLLLTDLARSSWLLDSTFANEVALRSEEDGSSCGWLNLVLECDTASEPVRVGLQTIAVESLCRRLRSRLPYGRELMLNGKDGAVLFEPGEQSGLTIDDDAVTITLRTEDLTKLVDALRPHAGVFTVPGVDNVVLEVLRTEIKDSDGNVVEVVE